MKTTKNIPSYVSNWTDKYFHQSAFDVPINFPSKKTVSFLSRFKNQDRVKLYRGTHRYNMDNADITSWTYDKWIAKGYAQEIDGKVVEQEFQTGQILLDTTVLTKAEKKQLGYDYKSDDKEVLILGI